ncbi:calcium/sodium antiporter [Aerophototrophica crusticola]|uniref:Calcium/sodium antiporter n=1 Tax=Aerophototrophica crusticola TaxID=1709002 RepID=A0A858R828_9PROT|nr:calcium/sodium antiporter [Rhodospirillaceae bacterium B3]
MVYLAILGGLVLLLAGGELLVRGAVAVAKRLGVSPLMIGLTLVGFGTSTPELVASVDAALAGSAGIAMGNVVGSNIANILLILGISAALMPVTVLKGPLKRDGAVLMGSALLAVGFTLTGHIGRPVGALLVALLLAYIVWVYRSERTASAEELHQADDTVAEKSEPPGMGLLAGLVVAAAGLGSVVFGADLLVGGAIEVAKTWGVSDTLIGVTLVAVGTSMPELVTSVMAAVRKHGDVAFGNIVGSNIYNVMGILGVTALVQPLDVPAQIASFDIWVMLAVSALLVIFAWTSGRISRREGWILLAFYAAYIAVQIQIGAMAPAEAVPG